MSQDLTEQELAALDRDIAANEFAPDTAEELTRLIAEVRRYRAASILRAVEALPEAPKPPRCRECGALCVECA